MKSSGRIGVQNNLIPCDLSSALGVGYSQGSHSRAVFCYLKTLRPYRYYKNRRSPFTALLILFVIGALFTYPILIPIVVTVFIVKWYLRKREEKDIERKTEEYEAEISKPRLINEYQDIGLPYKKKPFYMTAAEYNFFKVLQQAVEDKYYIVPQVSPYHLVEVTTRDYTATNVIDRKSIDFVLFNKNGFTPRLAIELDDRSHERTDRKIRDHLIETILKQVGIPLVRFKTNYQYNLEEVKNLITLN
jgi:hypothetical protein